MGFGFQVACRLECRGMRFIEVSLPSPLSRSLRTFPHLGVYLLVYVVLKVERGK